MKWRSSLVAAIVSLAVVSFAIWRSGVLTPTSSGPDASQRETARVVGLGLDQFQRVRLVAQPRNESPTIRGAHLKSIATIEGDIPSDPAVTEALFLKFAEFESLRYGGANADEYARWRISSGFRLRPLEIMQKEWFIREAFKATTGAELPLTLDPMETFSRFYAFGLTASDGASNPHKVADDSSGVVAHFRKVTSILERPVVNGNIGTTLWYGRIAITMRKWWEPEPEYTPERILELQGSLLRAELGVITKFEDGHLCPRNYSFYWDPSASRWMLEHINDNNSDFSNATPLEY